MDSISQIVVQMTTCPSDSEGNKIVRALAQQGDFENIVQEEIIYADLSEADQQLWDDFYNMILTQTQA